MDANQPDSPLVDPHEITDESTGEPPEATHASSALHNPRAASIFAIIGALLLLLALNRPLFQVDFTVNDLIPDLVPYSSEEVQAAWRSSPSGEPRESVQTLAAIDWETHNLDVHAAPDVDPERVDALRGSLVRLGPSNPGGISAVEFAGFLLDVEPGALEPAASLEPAALDARQRLASIRTLLLIIYGVGMLAALVGLYTLMRVLRPLDTLQVAAHGTLGCIGTLAFGGLAVMTWIDPIVGQQLVRDGLLLGLVGAVAIWVSAFLDGNRRQLLSAPLLGAVLLAAIGGSGYLFVTL